jgi:hypothetical protein
VSTLKGVKKMKIGFDKLKNRVASEYEKKGMSPQKAKEVGAAVAAKVGRKKYGATRFAKMAKAGRKAK